MKVGRSSRILSVLAALLVIIALVLTVILVVLRVPGNRRFEEALLSAEIAHQNNNSNLVKRELLKASRQALSAGQWSSLLKLAAEEIQRDPGRDKYKLFTVLAGRGANRLPGEPQFTAYWTWGLLRTGDADKAAKYSETLSNGKWQSLAAEIRLKNAVGGSEEEVQDFVSELEKNSDPEFLSSAALLTGSAELTFDSALLYMLNGQVGKAFHSSEMLMSGERSWYRDSENGHNNLGNISTALAFIAYDAGYRDKAIAWLEQGIEDTDRRRTTSWESLQFLGDLYWDRFLLKGNNTDLESAGKAWNRARDIIIPGYATEEKSASDISRDIELPAGSWRLWINLSVQQKASGLLRKSEKTITEALVLFPDNNEVKSAWARDRVETEPALARRIIRSSASGNPVLGITQIEIDPESVTPRLYEARLWELFESVTSGNDIQAVDRRILTGFLLDYMSSRRNFSSVDVAIDRYLKVYPEEKWIYSWRLASDAVRGLAIIDLLSFSEDTESPYEVFRALAHSENSWRALHDSALFAIMASSEISEFQKGLTGSAAGDVSPQEANENLERIMLDLLVSGKSFPGIAGTPFADRIDSLEKSREDLRGKTVSRRREAADMAGASVALKNQAESLLDNALEDLGEINFSDQNLNVENQARILYLEAYLLKKTDRFRESREKAEKVLELVPDHAGARELLANKDEL